MEQSDENEVVQKLLNLNEELVTLPDDFVANERKYFGEVSDNTHEKIKSNYENLIKIFSVLFDSSKINEYYLGGDSKGVNGRDLAPEIIQDIYDNIEAKLGFMFKEHLEHFMKHTYFNMYSNYPKHTFNEAMVFGLIILLRDLAKAIQSGEIENWSERKHKQEERAAKREAKVEAKHQKEEAKKGNKK